MSFIFDPDSTITNISILVWAVAALRQRGSRYFYFFILLALEDPVALFLRSYFEFTSIDIYIYFDLFRFLSLFRKDEVLNNRYLFGAAFGFILLMHFMSKDSLNQVLLNAFIHFAIFLKFMEIIVKEISFARIVNIFLLMLIFYQLNTVTKVINQLTMFGDPKFFQVSLYYFQLSTIFQILIGLFFCIFTEKNQKLILRLR